MTFYNPRRRRPQEYDPRITPRQQNPLDQRGTIVEEERPQQNQQNPMMNAVNMYSKGRQMTNAGKGAGGQLSRLYGRYTMDSGVNPESLMYGSGEATAQQSGATNLLGGANATMPTAEAVQSANTANFLNAGGNIGTSAAGNIGSNAGGAGYGVLSAPETTPWLSGLSETGALTSGMEGAGSGAGMAGITGGAEGAGSLAAAESAAAAESVAATSAAAAEGAAAASSAGAAAAGSGAAGAGLAATAATTIPIVGAVGAAVYGVGSVLDWW